MAVQKYRAAMEDLIMKFAIATLALMAITLASAQAQTPNSGSKTAPVLITGVKTDKKTYSLGAPVKITFTVENKSDKDISIDFPTGQRYDIWIEKDGNEVWRWSHGMMFTQAFGKMALKAGGKKTYEQIWQQVDNDGKQVSPGTYSVMARIASVSPRTTPVVAQITIGTEKPPITPTVISRVVQNGSRATGQRVSVTGTYLGWRPIANSPACKKGPPVNRSDWAISDKTGCIFVHGQNKLDPQDDYGKKVTVIGTVKQTRSGQTYIEAESVTVVK